MQRVAIIGTGSFAREVLDIFTSCNKMQEEFEVLGFIDENPSHWGKENE